MWHAAINAFDLGIIHWLNGLVGRSIEFDKAIVVLTVNDLRSAVIVSLCWWFWFRSMDPATKLRTREHVLCTLFAGIVAIVAGRFLALTLPFRIRPRYEPTLHFALPDGDTGDLNLLDWSSFPSDHAVMFAAIAVGLCFISWRIGLLAILYTVFIIGLPRVYLGLHYPSDIVAGLALGAVTGYSLNVAGVSKKLASRALQWECASPGGFYFAMCIVSFEFSTMFNSLRAVGLSAVHLGAHLIALSH